MSGIDNSFVNRYIQFKKDGISQSELEQIKKDATAQSYTTEASHSLTREIIKDGKIDKDEQKVLQAIGQGAKDITVAQKYAQSIDPTNSEISKLIMMGFKNKPQVVTQTQDVSKMGNTQKVIEAIKGSLKYVGPELRAKLEEMLTPKNIAIMGGVLATYAASHAVGVGFIADGLLFAAGALTLGKDAIDVAKKLYGFSKDAINAKNPQDLDKASKQFASAAATIISDLPALIGMKNIKVNSKTVGVPVPSMKPVMTTSGAAVLAPAISVTTVTFPVIQLSKAKATAIGASVMMSKGNGNGGSSIPPEYNNVPSKLKGDIDGTIDISKFTQRQKGGDLIDPKTGYKLSPERARNSGTGGHGGSYWKLIDHKGNRVGTISQDGKFLRG
jgi:hypothetical protein